MIMKVQNHGFKDNLLIQCFYNGINEDSNEMVDHLTAGGAVSNLMLPQCIKLFEVRSFNDEQYNPIEDVKPRKRMFHIPHELMPEVKKSMEEEGIGADLVK